MVRVFPRSAQPVSQSLIVLQHGVEQMSETVNERSSKNSIASHEMSMNEYENKRMNVKMPPNPVYIPAVGLNDWRKLLAKSDRHWRDKYFAVFIASSWHQASGFP